MDPNRRYLLLDGFVAPDAGGRSVASVVENRVIGIVGNSLVMPVVPGLKLDPTYEFGHDRRRRPASTSTPPTRAPPMRISVPTTGRVRRGGDGRVQQLRGDRRHPLLALGGGADPRPADGDRAAVDGQPAHGAAVARCRRTSSRDPLVRAPGRSRPRLIHRARRGAQRSRHARPVPRPHRPGPQPGERQQAAAKGVLPPHRRSPPRRALAQQRYLNGELDRSSSRSRRPATRS